MKRKQRFLFLIPNPSDFPSGGNIYNAQWLQSLENQGIEVAHTDDLNAFKQLQTGDFCWIDSLYLKASFDRFWKMFPATPKGIIFHHLNCLEVEFGSFSFWECMKWYLPYFQQAARILVTSEFSRDFLQKVGIPANKITCREPVFVWQEKEKVALKLPVQAIMVANLIPRKGILEFLQVLRQRVSIHHQFFLTIIGSDQLEKGYAQVCKQVIAQSSFLRELVTFAGEIPFELMAAQYEKAQVFISASSMETFGMAIQEAKALGLYLLLLSKAGEGGNVSNFLSASGHGQLCTSMPELVHQFLSLTNTIQRNV